MKNILFSIALFFTVAANAQVIKPDLTRSPNGPNTIVDWNVKFKTMIIPHGNTFTLAGAQDSTGHLRLRIASDTSVAVYIKGYGWLQFANKRDVSAVNNGLNNTSGVIKLGGDLLHHTSINTSTYNLILGNVTTFANGQGLIAVGLGSFGLVGLLNDKIAQIGNNSSGDIEIIKSDHLNVGKQQAIRFLDTGIVVNNTIDSSGIKYKSAIDYSKMKPLSLTPKIYVDAATGALSSIYARKDTLNNFVKRRFGVIHLADTAALKSYADTARTIFLDDTTMSGTFHYQASISRSDGGIWFKSTILLGSWQREFTGPIHSSWFAGYGDGDFLLGTGTDKRAALQRMYDSQPSRSGEFYIDPSPNRKWYKTSGPLKIGQTTRTIGAVPSLPIQINTIATAGQNDTLYYKSPSTVWCSANADVFITDTVNNIRPQLPNFSNISVVGSGRTNGHTGINMLRNQNFSTTNPASQDVGLGAMNGVYVMNCQTDLDLHTCDTYWLEQCHFSTARVAIRGGKQDVRVDKTCIFDVDTAYTGGMRYGIWTGGEIQPGNNGVGLVFQGTSEGSSIVSQHNTVTSVNIGNSKQGVVLKAGSFANSIDYNHFIGLANEYFIRFDSAGRFNSVRGNKYTTPIKSILKARKTDRFSFTENTPTGSASGFPMVAADTCLNIQVDHNYDIVYATNQKLTGFGSTSQDYFNFQNADIIGNDGLNSTPAVKFFRYGGNDFNSPAGLASGTSIGAIRGFGYGTSLQERATIEMKSNEAWSGTVNGSIINFSVTQVGTLTNSVYASLSRPAGANALWNVTGDIKNSGLVTFSNFTTAGILHNAVTTGSVSSSLIASADLGSSLALPGNPTTTTQTSSDNTTKIATTAFVKAQGYGTGTVTSITPGPLFTSSTPITGSGTLTIDTTKVFVKNAANQNVSATVSFGNNTYYAQNLLYQPGVGVSYKGSTGFFTGIFVSDATATRIIRFGPGNLIDSVQYLSGYPIKGTPTIVAGTGAGTSPTLTVTTNGRGLQVKLTVGTLPVASGIIGTITLPTALVYTPYPVFSSPSGAGMLLTGTSMIGVDSSSPTSIVLTAGTVALPAGSYIWNIKL